MDGRNRKFILDLQKRREARRESGLFVVDGPRMAAEIPPDLVEEVYVTNDFLASSNAGMCRELLSSTGFITVKESEMRQMSDTVNPQGILALVRQKKQKGLRSLFEGISDGKEPLLMILETVQDPGNMGTILRAAEAAGVSGIIMNSESVDIYSPKVVRSTMGALFRVPCVVAGDLIKAVDIIINEYNIHTYAAHLKGACDYCSVDYKAASAIMIGNEAHGLSDELAEHAEKAIIIPMCGKTESLNAAMAASVIAFEAARQRRERN